MRRLRFALLFNGTSLERWHLGCLEQLEQVADLAGVVVAPDHPRSLSPWAQSKAMRSYARRIEEHSTVDVTGRFAGLPRISLDANRPPDEGRRLDFVLRLGRVSTPGDIVSAARYGVWFFEHESDGDLLPFFREVHEAEDVTRAALVAVAAEDELTVLEEGFFRTERKSYSANVDRVVNSIAAWPARVCRRLLAGVDAGVGARGAAGIGSTRAPAPRVRLLRYVSVTTRRRLEVAWQRLFRHPQWNIGVLKVPVGALLSPGAYADNDIEWLPLSDRAGFLADPFGIVRDARLHILCEYFEYREGKGHIRSLEWSADGLTSRPVPALTLPVHMSYPFLIEDADGIYCIPETSAAHEVALFRASEFPRRWSKIAVLLEDVAGLDPTVFRHDGRWWLMCTRKGLHEDEELWVWHAPELAGPWTPHARNPVKTDVRGARPGGPPFVHEGVLYRPAQDCSRTYGWRIAVQRVLRLTPTEFAEEPEPVAILQASAHSPFPCGRHTLTPVGDVVLVDGHRTVFVGAAFRAFLRIWARDLVGKARPG